MLLPVLWVDLGTSKFRILYRELVKLEAKRSGTLQQVEALEQFEDFKTKWKDTLDSLLKENIQRLQPTCLDEMVLAQVDQEALARGRLTVGEFDAQWSMMDQAEKASQELTKEQSLVDEPINLQEDVVMTRVESHVGIGAEFDF